MPIKIICPNPECNTSYRVDDDKIGRSTRCKKCGTKFSITATEADPSSAPSTHGLTFERLDELTLEMAFGRYRILQLLGSGAMGTVYLALDTVLDRQVALKIPQFSSSDGPEVIQRFYREAKSAAGLDHVNICQVYDVGEIDGLHYLTMAYIEGKTLDHYIKTVRIEQYHAANMVKTILFAMEESHHCGVVHRDLKPANIMVSQRRSLVIMDFGLAWRAASQDPRITETGRVLGTPAYMSPEQIEGDTQRVGPLSDLYSIGVILFELLTGTLPFQGPLISVMIKIKTEAPPPPRSFNANIDPALADICLRAMAKDPADRFRSCREFADTLDQWMLAYRNRAHTPTANVGSERTTSDTQTTFEFDDAPPLEKKKSSVPWRPTWVYLVVALYVGLLGMITFMPLLATVYSSAAQSWNHTILNLVSGVIFAGFMLFLGGSLLYIPISLHWDRPVTQRSIIFPIIGSATAAMMLFSGGAMAFHEGIFGGEEEKNGVIVGILFLIATGAVWLVWVVVFGMLSHSLDPMSLSNRMYRTLLMGSVLELFVAIMSHIVARRRSECCAGIPSAIGIGVGFIVMLVALGPAVFFLFHRRFKQVYSNTRKKTPDTRSE